MFSAFKKFGKLGALASSVARAWSPLALWPDGIDTPGMWISPRDLTSQWQDYTGTTPVATPGTVADSSNPVGLALDIRAGATVLTDPGNHMLQSTSAARPLASARVNLLKYTEDFTNGVWDPTGVTVTENAAIAPDGTTSAWLITPDIGTSAVTNVICQFIAISSTRHATKVYIKSAGVRYVQVSQYYQTNYGFRYSVFDTQSGTWTYTSNDGGALDYAGEALANGWFALTYTGVPSDSAYGVLSIRAAGGPTYTEINTVIGDGVVGIYVWHPQIELGTTSTDYQSVPGDGSSYSSTGFPIAQKYDGVDDGMATAAFAAGTLTSGMDCMIAVRRDSSAHAICGLYEPGRGNAYIGAVDDASSTSCVGGDAGLSWTAWVDGVLLTGGASVTQSQLSAAMSVGDYHILEFRNLDLSSWAQLGSGAYGSGYNFPGGRGDIMLYPSTASTEDKDAARQWLADYYGVTLP